MSYALPVGRLGAPVADPIAIDDRRRLKRDRDRRSAKLRRAGGAVLEFRAHPIGAIGDALVDAGKLPQWDSENADAVAAAIADMVCDGLGLPRMSARRQDENSDVAVFEPADSGNR